MKHRSWSRSLIQCYLKDQGIPARGDIFSRGCTHPTKYLREQHIIIIIEQASLKRRSDRQTENSTFPIIRSVFLKRRQRH